MKDERNLKGETTARLLLETARRGWRIQKEDGRLHLRGPDEGLPVLLQETLRARKADLLAAFETPRKTAAEVWETAVREVAERWNALFSGTESPPWIDDLEIQERIGDAIRAADVGKTLLLAAEWTERWEAVIAASS